LSLPHEHTQAAEVGAGIIIRGGVARGEPGRGLGGANRWAKFEQAKLDELLEDGETRTGFLLRFTLSHPHCDTTIVGTVSLAHLQENLAIAQMEALPTEIYAEAKRRLDAVGESPE
jgi:aryl-alcohol dehydrogenase-like predicted oxidoreductase